jgi:hypothetical protein
MEHSKGNTGGAISRHFVRLAIPHCLKTPKTPIYLASFLDLFSPSRRDGMNRQIDFSLSLRWRYPGPGTMVQYRGISFVGFASESPTLHKSAKTHSNSILKSGGDSQLCGREACRILEFYQVLFLCCMSANSAAQTSVSHRTKTCSPHNLLQQVHKA